MSKSVPLHLESDEEIVRAAFESILARSPTLDEVRYGVGNLASGSARAYFAELLATREAVDHRQVVANAPLFVPPGHYYSPICNVSELSAAGYPECTRARELAGVDLAPERQRAIFDRLSRHFQDADFPATQTRDARYFVNNDFYGIGDALILSAFIREFQPRQIIEVGSGFSSAVMLDTLDRMAANGAETRCTFVEPYADRLRSLLRPSDLRRVSIVERGVQSVPLDLFAQLSDGDLLFLDTTHISRTGSDVNHEVFEVLPRLNAGVIVHFHDFFHNFEYPREWIIDQNRSWNEIYLVRAFLMFNSQFEILFCNHHFAVAEADVAGAVSPDFARHPGGGLWLRKL